ncbi:MAG: conjugal transfer protein TraO [Proteobacteria bacterium]|nr:MAG: conjugal transfer protein TraO [Pseudomonadota bacterium]
MKQRLLVMNGQKLLQTERAGEWQVDKVEKAGTIRPGIYNLYLSTPADQAGVHVGVVLHADSQFVYQQVGKTFVRHERTRFDQVPTPGAPVSIRYQHDQATVAAATLRVGRKLSR